MYVRSSTLFVFQPIVDAMRKDLYPTQVFMVVFTAMRLAIFSSFVSCIKFGDNACSILADYHLSSAGYNIVVLNSEKRKEPLPFWKAWLQFNEDKSRLVGKFVFGIKWESCLQFASLQIPDGRYTQPSNFLGM